MREKDFVCERERFSERGSDLVSETKRQTNRQKEIYERDLL
jgi:hypothetical protein